MKTTANTKIKEIVNQKKFKDKIRIDIFKNIIKKNLNATNEKILIIGDKGHKESLISPIITNAYSLAAQELGHEYETIYQNFKKRGDEADPVVVRKLLTLPKKSIIIVNISNRIGTLGDVGLSFRKFAKNNEHRFISSSSLGSINNKHLKFLIDCLDIDYEAIKKKTEKLTKTLTNAKEINVTTKIGTDLTFNVEGMSGKSATGIYREPGTGGNLPGSESYIAPAKNGVQGQIYLDGSLRVKDKTMLIENPVKLDIEKGSITKINNTYEARLLLETLKWAEKRSKNPENVWKIGELGIGLNEKAKVIGSTIIDEKTYGTGHIAIGSNSWFGGDIKTIIHLDQVFHKPTFKIDGKLLKY